MPAIFTFECVLNPVDVFCYYIFIFSLFDYCIIKISYFIFSSILLCCIH